MRSRLEVAAVMKIAVVMLVLTCGSVWAEAPQPPPAPPSTASPSREAVVAAIAKLRLDPNLGQEHKMRTLHWKESKESAPPPDAPSWLMGLFDYLGQAGSLLMWLGGAILAAFVIVWSFRFFSGRARSTKLGRPKPVSHIGDLDIRPDSLPDDVGAAALVLLNAGRVRDALSLLYRGALSRAVHGFGVAIQESHTEGEALRVVVAALDAPRADYFRELVALWQGAVYAGQPAPIAPVAALCSSFATQLGDPA